MATLQLDDVALTYEESGDSRLPPLVLIHGLSSSRATWSRLTPELAKRFHVFAFDQRGHGESSHADGTYTLEHYVPDAIAFMERVVGSPAVVAGHSLGGVVAAVLGRRRPDLVRGVFLEDPPLLRTADSEPSDSGVARMFPAMYRLLSDMRARGAPYEEYEAMIAGAPAMNGAGTMREAFGEESVRAHARSLYVLDPEVFTPAIERTALAGAEPTAPIGCPVGVLRADPALGAAFTPEDEAQFLRANPHAIVHEVAGASHAIHDEQPERFEHELIEFVDSYVESRSSG